jgi:vancomycin resistance protein YoaR
MKSYFAKFKFRLKLELKYHKHRILRYSKVVFWFLTGAFLALFFILSIGLLAYEGLYANKIYPGIYIENTNFGGESEQNLKNYLLKKNLSIANKSFVLKSDYGIATISARQIDFGYNTNLLTTQAYALGRSGNFISDLSIILQSYTNGVYLNSSYTYNQDKLNSIINPLIKQINIDPVDAVFNFENNRVTTFKPSSNGQTIDMDTLNNQIITKAPLMFAENIKNINIQIPIVILEPKITTEKVNNLGIKELIGEGHSLFYHSIQSRIYNISLAAGRLNGILVAPGDTFSFDKALGDVSAFTGYKQAYVIQNGKTVLGDGGGVCQVSTTFFRALLNAGLLITERHAHAYRVGYYEEDSPPGLDATIFVPSVDLKFKNDTGHYILIQSVINLDNLTLAFYLYGTKDGRTVNISQPVITSQTPAPPPLYQDNPDLPKGVTQQTDFAAAGANVYFTRTVSRNNKTIIYDKFVSNYQPWQAIYQVGTK